MHSSLRLGLAWKEVGTTFGAKELSSSSDWFIVLVKIIVIWEEGRAIEES